MFDYSKISRISLIKQIIVGCDVTGMSVSKSEGESFFIIGSIYA